ncbi:MAG: S8 family serine peptidase, partial [Acidimicrobiaceae bacterium]
QRDNAIGISGIAPDAKILPIRILDSRGDGSESDLVQAIRLAVEQGAKVINLSLGGRTQTTALQLALEFAELNKVVVVAAAGNGGSTASTTYPAGNDLALAVTAVDQTSNAPSFNQRGAYIDVAAPGVSICSTVRIDSSADPSR